MTQAQIKLIIGEKNPWPPLVLYVMSDDYLICSVFV